MRVAAMTAAISVVACTGPTPAPPVPSALRDASRQDTAPAATSPPTPRAMPSASDAAADAAPSVDEADAAVARSDVGVVTIGMHVGGGPYDEPTKEPMKRSVEPRFPDLTRCWAFVASTTPVPREVDAGVDLVIPAKGGRARVSNPRTTVKAEGFAPCVVGFFESVEFLPPNGGQSTVSYSVRFRRRP